MAERNLRRSQAIHPYGPGAILDWGQECFVVLDTTFKNPGWRFAQKIHLPRLEEHLGVEGFRLPPVREGFGRGSSPLKVQRFPSWLFCPKCRAMARWTRDREIDAKGRVPKCGKPSCRAGILVPMRYVAACEGGHLADIDWFRWAHAGPSECDRRSARLELRARSGRGASLEALQVRCTACSSSGRSLRRLLDRNALDAIGQKCPGRQPWQSRDDERPCEQGLRALQRSQTAVHFSQVESALDIRIDLEGGDPRRHAILSALERFADYSEEDFRGVLPVIARRLTKERRREDPTSQEVTEAEVEEVRRSGSQQAQGLYSRAGPESDRAERGLRLLREECEVLTSEVPEHTKQQPIVVQQEVRRPGDDESLLDDLIDGVFLVRKLREVRAFEGFRRVDSSGQLVNPDLGEVRPKWLPASEVFGEGIFLRFHERSLLRWEGEHEAVFLRRSNQMERELLANDHLSKKFSGRLRHLGRYLLVHTFSHLLIRQLCYQCGYHAASIRERLYVFEDRAGVLLYTADGDSEGSLGGLVRQGRSGRLDGTVLAALQSATWCSNDPVCRELPGHGPGRSNRAACHACAMVAETSCTEFNGMLDRMIVVGGVGADRALVRGYFSDALDRALEVGQA